MTLSNTHPAREALWARAQAHLDAGRRPSEDLALTEAALGACPDELEALLLLEAALDGLAEPAAPAAPAPRRPRLAPLVRPALAASLLACLALWTTRPGPAPVGFPGVAPVHHLEVTADRGPYGSVRTAPVPTPAIESFSLTVSRSRLAAQPLPTVRQAPATRSAIRELVATRTHSTPNRP